MKCLNGLAIILIAIFFVPVFLGSCAQIGMPTGGERDSLPPQLIRANPPNNTVNFQGDKITLTFDEYVTLKDITNNVYISPYQQYNPVLNDNLQTVTIKLKDRLQSNTTYTISFGNGIQDVNEGNILRNFKYVFSTGRVIDSLFLSGKILLAETGLADSTLVALVYRNPVDSTVTTKKPTYLARLDGSGNFTINNMPPGTYGVYGLRDGDNSKTYNSKAEEFAFLDSMIVLPLQGAQPILYAYVEKPAQPAVTKTPANTSDKKFRYRTSLSDSTQPLTKPLTIAFNRNLQYLRSEKINLFDSLFNPVTLPAGTRDSTGREVSFNVNWRNGITYYLVIPSDVAADTTGTNLSKTDTLRFKVNTPDDYGNLSLRFTNPDLGRHPVLQFYSGDVLRFSYPLSEKTFTKSLFEPGEYSLRILYDDNQNGKWDPGNFELKLQPERAVSLPQKLAIKAGWDNEREITL